MKPLIDQWHHAARCRHETSQRKAWSLWYDLKSQLTSSDATELMIAWLHNTEAEQSPKELDYLISRIGGKYRERNT